MDNLYSDILLDLYRHPLNKQPLGKFDVHTKEANPTCGDEVEIFIKFDKKDKISNIGWQGEGCAISQTATSLLTDYVKGKKKQDIKKIDKDKILKMLGLEKINPTRMRCALLSLQALNNAINS